MINKKSGFTLIELIGVLVTTAIITLIATPLVMNIIKNVKDSTRKRSIDNYGKAIELAIADYLLDNGKFPTKVDDLTIEYKGDKVECEVEYINDDNTVYLEGCEVNGKKVNHTYGIDKRPAALQLISKANKIEVTNYNDGNKGEMYTFDHESTVQTPALTDYRYIGNIPKNYVSFNNETWRIIGVFDTDDGTGKYEKRIKLVRNESIGSKQWNSSNVNEWVGSTIQEYLNDSYVINDESEIIIDKTKYYLGGLSSYTNGELYYKAERGNTVYLERNTYWNGVMALMYPSDYIFAYSLGVDDSCYTNGYNCGTSSEKNSSWIYNSNNNKTCWLLSTNSSGPYYAAGVIWNGSVRFNSSFPVSAANAIHPVLYLKPEVKIKQGDGTKDNPYVFEL